MTARWGMKVVVAFGLMAILGACEQDTGQGPTGKFSEDSPRKVDEEFAKAPREAAGSSTTITAKSVQFRPNPNTIAIGTSVSFVNADSFAHNVTSGKRGAPDGRFAKELTGIGISLDYTFSEPGTYEYHCTLHPDMNGQVVVQ